MQEKQYLFGFLCAFRWLVSLFYQVLQDIIKEGVPVVIGRAKGSVKRVFTMKAKEMNAPINYADSIFPYNPTDWLPYPEMQALRKRRMEWFEE